MSTTPFEDSSKLTLTTLAEEATFVNALVSNNPGVISKTVLGQSVEERDIYALRLGTATGNAPLLVLGCVHGNENVPREAILTLARDICETAHGWSSLLASRELILVPTVNPDGLYNSEIRLNANGEDINRHYLDLHADSPETGLIVDLIYDEMPVAIFDGHEWTDYGSDGTFIGNSTFCSVDPTVREASISVGNAIQSALLSEHAVSTGWYPRNTPAQTVQHLTAQLGIIPTLFESTCSGGTYTSGRPDRHAWAETALATWLDHMQTNAASYQSIGVSARSRVAAKLGRTDSFWELNIHDPLHEGGSRAGACVSAKGYTIDSGDVATIGPVLASHGIAYDEGTGYVSLAQARAYIAALLLDPLSDAMSATATRDAPDEVSS